MMIDAAILALFYSQIVLDISELYLMMHILLCSMFSSYLYGECKKSCNNVWFASGHNIYFWYGLKLV